VLQATVETRAGNNELKWLVDSGATVHVTNDESFLKRRKRATSDTVTVGSGEKLHAQSKGTVTL
jgi:hypothetical protein